MLYARRASDRCAPGGGPAAGPPCPGLVQAARNYPALVRQELRAILDSGPAVRALGLHRHGARVRIGGGGDTAPKVCARPAGDQRRDDGRGGVLSVVGGVLYAPPASCL